MLTDQLCIKQTQLETTMTVNTPLSLKDQPVPMDCHKTTWQNIIYDSSYINKPDTPAVRCVITWPLCFLEPDKHCVTQLCPP